MLYTYLDVHHELDLSPQDSIELTQVCLKLERLLGVMQVSTYHAGPSPTTILGLEMLFRTVTARSRGTYVLEKC